MELVQQRFLPQALDTFPVFTQDYNFNSVLISPQYLIPESVMALADITAKLCQILLSVYNHPGIIKVHIIPDVKLRDKVVHTLPIKLFYYFLYRFGLFPAVDLYIQAIITSS